MLKRREFLKRSALVATAASTGILTVNETDALTVAANDVNAVAARALSPHPLRTIR